MTQGKKAGIAMATLSTLLGGGCVALGLLYNAERAANRDLLAQLAELSQKEKRAAVLQSISAQMEDIAYQQKTISDEQREAAERQTLVANEMRHRSELERQNALEAKAEAVASERVAHEAQTVAEHQRQVAEQQRQQAETAKSMADTLSYVALGRSLGSLSATQYQAGNADVADLLAYASYVYTTRYGGDVYNQAVFQALTNASQSKQTQPVFSGAATAVTTVPGHGDVLVSVSNYGEMMLVGQKDGKPDRRMLLSNSQYDFRDVSTADDGTVCAVSRTGHLALYDGSTVSVVPLTEVGRPMGIARLSATEMLVVGERQVAVFDMVRRAVTGSRELTFRVVAIGQRQGRPLLFDQRQLVHPVASLSDIGEQTVPVRGTVAAYACSDDGHLAAYGMTDGTIYLTDPTGRSRQLVGHLSRISCLRFNGQQLCSTSYDGVLNLWALGEGKIEPMAVFNARCWLMDFAFDESRQYVVAADQNGNLTQALVAVPSMVSRIRSKLSRNLTPDEWNYYIGASVPYERFAP